MGKVRSQAHVAQGPDRCCKGVDRALEEPGRPEEEDGFRRASPKVGGMVHAVRQTQGREGGAVFYEVGYGFRIHPAVAASRVNGPVNSVLVGEQRGMVAISQASKVDS